MEENIFRRVYAVKGFYHWLRDTYRRTKEKNVRKRLRERERDGDGKRKRESMPNTTKEELRRSGNNIAR